MDDKDPIKNYLLVEQKNAEKEMHEYEKKIRKEYDRKVEEMQKEKERKMKELSDRQDRMFNWEEQVKKDEQKMMLRIAEQKNAIMAKKLEEQQNEILRNMNQKDVDGMLEKHKEQLKNLDLQLQSEQ